jgi:hypothetical protein
MMRRLEPERNRQSGALRLALPRFEVEIRANVREALVCRQRDRLLRPGARKGGLLPRVLKKRNLFGGVRTTTAKSD